MVLADECNHRKPRENSKALVYPTRNRRRSRHNPRQRGPTCTAWTPAPLAGVTSPALLAPGNRTLLGSYRIRKMSIQIKIERLSQLGIRPCPTAGSGVHSWLFHAAIRCRDAGLQQEQAITLVERELTRPAQPSNEVKQAVSAAYNTAQGDRVAGFPKADRDAIGRLVRSSGMDCAALAAKSPIKNPTQEEVMRVLFECGDRVCTGGTVGSPLHWGMPEEGKELPYALSRAQFIVPSPMAAPWGVTKAGDRSKRAQSNVGPRRWLVVECDFTTDDAREYGASSTFDVCAAVLWKLAEFRSLVLVVHSGGKSLHGWFPVNPGEDEPPESSDLWRFMAYACRLGADPKTWSVNQWVRCPLGSRRDSQGNIHTSADGDPVIQRVLYFDPATPKGGEL